MGKPMTNDEVLELLMQRWDATIAGTVPGVLLPLHRHMAQGLYREALDGLAAVGVRLVQLGADSGEAELMAWWAAVDPQPGEEGEFPVEVMPSRAGEEETLCVSVCDHDPGEPWYVRLDGWGYTEVGPIIMTPTQWAELAFAGFEVCRQIEQRAGWEAEEAGHA